VLTPRKSSEQEQIMSDVVWVQMTISISGGRADGRNWPNRFGEPIDLPPEEAWPLIRNGNAREVAPPASSRPLPPPASATPAPVSEPAATARGPIAAGGTSFTPTGPADVTEHSWGLTGPAANVSDETPPADTPAAPAVSDETAEIRQRPSFATVGDLEPPKPAAPKQEWVEHAMAHGETEDEANMQTKAALMSKYGGRL
jgi:hypothetical protein